MKRSYLKPGKGFTRQSSLRTAKANAKPGEFARTRMRQGLVKRVGRRTSEWDRAWKFLKPRLEAAGRIYCELSFVPHACSTTLTPAHSRKRREMQGDDIYMVCLACTTGHQILDERMSHEDMHKAVMRAINENGGPILPEKREAA